MSNSNTAQPVIDGFSGFPIEVRPPVAGPVFGTVEGLLDAVERHANAERDALGRNEDAIRSRARFRQVIIMP